MAVASLEPGVGTGDPGFGIPGSESQIPGSRAVTVERLDDDDAFAELRDEWRDLLRDSASNNPFLTSEWLQAWWAHLADGSRLELIVVRSGGLLVGLAPMRLVGGGLPWFSRLEFLGTGAAGSDYLDLILRQGYETEILRAIEQYLASRQLALRLTHLPPASWGAKLAARLAGEGWALSSADDGTCPIIPLAGHTFDSYLATLGSSHRANVRRRVKALSQQFDVRFDLVTTHAERCEMLGALVTFHERRYKEQGGSSAFTAPEVIAFQDEASRRALESGFLRMYALRLNGQLAAVMYGFFLGGRFYFYQHGFDDQYKAHSIGLVLMALTVRAAIDEGAAEFDMLWGVEAYKFLWARDARVLQRVELFPIHIGGTLHRHALEARRGMKQLARRVLAIGVSLGS
jgi:CelD/BcsL family acetyltransferase involved in cellulose biosynthesis